MDTNNLEYHLKFIVINKEPLAQSAADNSESDAWLDNDDTTILEHFENEAQEQNSSIKDVVATISEPNAAPNQRIFSLESLELQYSADGFVINTDNGSQILQDGDHIYLPACHLQAKIVKKQIVNNPDPTVDEQQIMPQSGLDMWQTAMPIAADVRPTVNMDPFHDNLLPITQDNRPDPLNFLYGPSQEQPQYGSDSLIPQASGLGALPYDPIPMVNSPMPNLPQTHQSALDINTQIDYQPAALNNLSQGHDDRRPSYEQSQRGNVLRDLGIDESTSVVTDITQTQQVMQPMPATQEQSPMDMLDEYLQDEPLADYQNYHNEQGLVQTAQPLTPGYASQQINLEQTRINNENNLLGTIRNIKKRILG